MERQRTDNPPFTQGGCYRHPSIIVGSLNLLIFSVKVSLIPKMNPRMQFSLRDVKNLFLANNEKLFWAFEFEGKIWKTEPEDFLVSRDESRIDRRIFQAQLFVSVQ